MEEFLRTLNDISLIEPTTGVLSAGIAACLLLLVSAFASGSEIAFFSLTPSDLNQMDEEKSSDDAKITKLRQDSERTLATILIANNLVNVAIIMLFTYFFHHIIDFADAWWVEFGFMTILLTFLLLLFRSYCCCLVKSCPRCMHAKTRCSSVGMPFQASCSSANCSTP